MLPTIQDHYYIIVGFSNVPAGKPWSTTFYYEYIDGSSAEDLVTEAMDLALADFFAADVATSDVGAFVSNNVQLESITTYDLSFSNAPFVKTSGFTWTGGTSTANSLPPDLSIVASKRTKRRGRAGRGRNYFAGWTESSLASAADEGGIVPALAAGIETGFRDSLINVVQNGRSMDLKIVSMATGSPDVIPVTNVTVDTNWDVQRRRGNA